MELQSFWKQCSDELKGRIPAPLYRTLIEPVQVSSSDDILELTIPDETRLKHLTTHYAALIEGLWRKQVSAGRIKLLLAGQKRTNSSEPSVTRPAKTEIEFMAGSMHADAKSILNLKFDAPVVFIHGPTACGKTTLLKSLQKKIQETSGQSSYFTVESFVTDFAEACRDRKLPDFRKKLRKNRLLAIDDLQFLKEGARQTQEEIRGAIDACEKSEGTVVFASDLSPDQLPLRVDLISRISQGRLIRLDPPGLDIRTRLLTGFCLDLGLELTEAQLSKIACATPDARRLRGVALNLKLLTHTDALTDNLVEKMLLNLGVARPEAEIILTEVARFCGVKVTDLMGTKRDKRIAGARHIAVFQLRSILGMAPAEICRLMRKKHHTGILYAMEKASRQMEEDMFFRHQMQELADVIRRSSLSFSGTIR